MRFVLFNEDKATKAKLANGREKEKARAQRRKNKER
jgi:hypothetical protein